VIDTNDFDAKTRAGLGKIVRAAQSSSLERPTPLSAGCWAKVRIYIGQSRLGGTWVPCSKRPRPGKRTCHWHRHLEDRDGA
jgi:hypothetical protein